MFAVCKVCDVSDFSLDLERCDRSLDLDLRDISDSSAIFDLGDLVDRFEDGEGLSFNPVIWLRSDLGDFRDCE
jgi:hypothetical protein